MRNALIVGVGLILWAIMLAAFKYGGPWEGGLGMGLILGFIGGWLLKGTWPDGRRGLDMQDLLRRVENLRSDREALEECIASLVAEQGETATVQNARTVLARVRGHED